MGFGAGTKILMADGTEKSIENVKTGDLVLSFDQLNAFGNLESKRVIDTFSRIDRNPLKIKVNNSNVELTIATGQLFIDSGNDWKEANNINEIIDGNGNVHSFDVSQITRGKHLMFDIIVEDNHSLIANGVRVHNMIYRVNRSLAKRTSVNENDLSGSNRKYGDDFENTNYSAGLSRKKKGKKKKTYNTEVKVDGIVTSANFISSIENLVDSLSEIVEETTPTNLTSIKLAIQTSADNILSYLTNFNASIINATMSTYDKSEVLSMTNEMNAAAIAMRKPFEDTVVSASGKNIAVNQLNVIRLLILRIKNRMQLYTETPKEEVASKLSSSKKSFKSTRAVNGKYNVPGKPNAYKETRPEGGRNNSAGPAGPSRSGSGGVNNGGNGSPNQSTRSTGGQKPGPSKPGPSRTGNPANSGPGSNPTSAPSSRASGSGANKPSSPVSSGGTYGGSLA